MSQTDPSTMSRRQQMVETYKLTKQSDPKIGLILGAIFVVVAAVAGVIFWFLPGEGIFSWIFTIVGALLAGLLAAMVVFSRRAQKVMYARLEGQVGGGYAALTMLRRGWTVTQAVGVEPRSQTLVHRVVGPPGVVLVGEGNSPSKVRSLLASTKRNHARVLGEVPITTIVAGNGEDEIPLPRLTKHVTKIGRKVAGPEITDIINRLKAVDATRGTVPIPKGPVPTSMKGMRGNLRGR
ncbi:DUF4191 family protein [Nocardioides sp.]|uniref:DUF4191 family protein n=1 Tax=Nocardioides sp. TaxID=35761 RepID=UPI0019AB32F2|nr:DUF4191 family protein [Nocardioides sp.]MBC7279814.1 DUF4191 family protein [Nocardioides sp.]